MGDVIGFLTYDDKDCREFGIYVNSSGIHAAPERDIEEIEIPGRNGSLTIDHGRFKNIDIEYPALILDDYANMIDEFKGFMYSRSGGYHRLEDSFSPDYYRLAKFNNSIAPEAGMLDKYGKFIMTFNCDPRRFLKVRDTLNVVNEYTPLSGEHSKVYETEIINPTYFASKPNIYFAGVYFKNVTFTAVIKVINLDNENEYYTANFSTKAYGSTEEFSRYLIKTEVGGLYEAHSTTAQPTKDDLKFTTIKREYLNLRFFKHTKLTITMDYTASGTADGAIGCYITPEWWTI